MLGPIVGFMGEDGKRSVRTDADSIRLHTERSAVVSDEPKWQVQNLAEGKVANRLGQQTLLLAQRDNIEAHRGHR